MRVEQVHPQRVAFAHVLRGFAAALVVFVHLKEAAARWMRDTLPVAPSTPRPAVELDDFSFNESIRLFNEGKVGVALFFLISGFVIPFALCNQSRVSFSLGRFFRLWPTYAAGFSISVFAISILAMSADQPFAYSASEIAVHYLLIFRDLISYPNIDWIVWTLEVEVRFYLLCTLIAPLLRSANSAGLLLVGASVAGLSFLSDLAQSGWGMSGLRGLETSGAAIVFMLIGVAYNFAFRGGIGWPTAAALIGTFFAMFAVLQSANTSGISTLFNYSIALLLFASAFRLRSHFSDRGPLGWMGSISYSLYVVHPVFGAAILTLFLDAGLPMPVALVSALAVVLASAWLLHRGVERPTHELGRRLSKRVDRLRAHNPGDAVTAQLAGRLNMARRGAW